MRSAAEEPDFSRVEGQRTAMTGQHRIEMQAPLRDGPSGDFARSGGALAEQTGSMLSGGGRARVGFEASIHHMECKHALRYSAFLSWRYEGSIREGNRGGAPKPGPPAGRPGIPCRRAFGGWLDDHGCA